MGLGVRLYVGRRPCRNAAPRLGASRAAVSMSAITPGDVGTTKPLGVWDPLDLIQNDAVKYRRWQEMEIKDRKSVV